MRANRERGEHGTENASSCSRPNGDHLPEYVTIREATLREALMLLRLLRRVCIQEATLTAETRGDLAVGVANVIADILNDIATGREVRHG